MKLAVACVVFPAVLAIGQTTQETPPPDASSSAPPQAPLSAPVPPPPPAFDRPVSLRLLVPNLVHDQGQIWSFPARIAKGHNWIPTVAILGTMGGLLALDPIEGAYFKHTRTFQGFNSVFTGNDTAIGMIAAPAALYAIGLFRKDSKMERTALFAGKRSAMRRS